MCGIAGVYFESTKSKPFSDDVVENLIDGLLLGIEERGRHATGIATMSTNGVMDVEKADLPASDFILWRRPDMMKRKTRSILLHTRYATQGSPTNLNNNHPIPYEDTVIIHNGHISNDHELFRTEEMNRIAQVDSEVIAALFHKYGLDKAHIPLGKLDGNFAVAAVDRREPNSLVLAKGYSSPLVYCKIENMLIWASTEKAIVNAVDYAIGTKLTSKNMDDLALGEILYMENGSMNEYKFEPFERPVSSYWSGDWSSRPGDWYYGESENKKGKKKRDRSVSIKKAKSLVSGYLSRPISNVYETCADCLIPVLKEEAMLVGALGYFCEDCYLGADAVYNMVNNGSCDVIDSTLQDEHEVVLELVAEKFGVGAGYVDWLIFESGAADGKIASGKMLSDFTDFSEAYDEFYTQLLEEEEEDEDVDDFSFINEKTLKLLDAGTVEA